MLNLMFSGARSNALLLLLAILIGAACASHGGSQRKNEQGVGLMNDESKAPVIYVALGDSTGVGVGAKEGGYVARLFERIKRERPSSRLANLCVSGATSNDVLREQLAPALDARPSLVTIGVGINDVSRSVSPENFARNYETIVQRITSETRAVVVVTNLPDISLAPAVPPYLREEAHSRVLSYNERIKEIAERHGLLLVDAYTMTREIIPAHPEFFSSDNFHPSDAGYEYWAKLMWPIIKSALEQ